MANTDDYIPASKSGGRVDGSAVTGGGSASAAAVETIIVEDPAAPRRRSLRAHRPVEHLIPGVTVDLEESAYPYKPPRVSDAYQAETPDISEMRAPIEGGSREGKDSGFDPDLQAKYVEEDLRHGQVDLLDGRVWAGCEWDDKPETDEWLMWCRKAMYPALPSAVADEESEVTGKLPIRHMETDEQALRFLARCRYDINMAKFLITACIAASHYSKLCKDRELGIGIFAAPMDNYLDDGKKDVDIAEANEWLSRASLALSQHTAPPTLSTLSTLTRDGRAFPRSALVKAMEGGDERVDVEEFTAAFEQVWSREKEATMWIARLQYELAEATGRARLPELEQLLNDSATLLTSLEEISLLRSIVSEAKTWKAKAKAVLAVDNYPGVNALQLLYNQAVKLPVQMPEQDLLRSKLNRVMDIQRHVAKVMATSFRRKKVNALKMSELMHLKRIAEVEKVQFPEMQELLHYSSQAEDWVARAKIACDERKSMKVFTELITELNKLPIDLSEESSKLKEELQRAQDWQAKVKKRVRLGKSRKHEKQKTGLSQIIRLYEESSSLCVKLEEVDQLQALIATATDCSDRAQNALAERGSTTVEELRSILADCDQLPVAIEVEPMLRSELLAREWAAKAAVVLESKSEHAVLVGMLRGAKEIRSGVPLSSKERSRWKIENENELKRALKFTDQWILRATKAAAKTTSLSRLHDLIAEAETFPVHLIEHTTQLQARLQDGINWVVEARQFMLQYRILTATDMDELVDLSKLTEVDVKSSPGGPAAAKTTIDEIKTLLTRGIALKISAEEISILETTISDIEKWQTAVQRFIAPADNEVDAHVGDESVPQSNHSVSIDYLKTLVSDCVSFPIDVEGPVTRLQEVIHFDEMWLKRATSILSTKVIRLDSNDLVLDYDKMLATEPESRRSKLLKNPIPEKIRSYVHLAGAYVWGVTSHRTEVEQLIEEIPKLCCGVTLEAALRLRSDAMTLCSDLYDFYEKTALESMKPKASQVFFSLNDYDAIINRVNDLIARQRAQNTCDTSEMARIAIAKEKRKAVVVGDEELGSRSRKKRKLNTEPATPITHASNKKESSLSKNSGDSASESSDKKEVYLPHMDDVSTVADDCLHAFKFIILEVSSVRSWRKSAAECLASRLTSKKPTVMEMKACLDKASVICCSMPEVDELRGHLQDYQTWVKKAKQVVDGEQKITLDDVVVMLNEKANCKINLEIESKALEGCMHAVQLWCAETLEIPGILTGHASPGDIATLIKAASSLPLDVTKEIAALEAHTNRYCLCRRSVEGFFVGCDYCSNWYHARCLGLSKTNAKRQKSYRCLLCSIKSTVKEKLESVSRDVVTTLQAFANSAAGDDHTTLREFFVSPKGSLTMNWLTRAVPLLSLQQDGLKSALQNPVKGWIPPVSVTTLTQEAVDQTLLSLPVVSSVCNVLRFVCWSVRAIANFRGDSGISPPTLHELLNDMPFPIPGVTTLLKDAALKGRSWQSKAKALLYPTSKASVVQLKSHLLEAQYLICEMPEENMLHHAINDGAIHHCVCKGFYTGGLLLKCTCCAVSFHGECVMRSVEDMKARNEAIADYWCPNCCFKNQVPYRYPQSAPPDRPYFNCKVLVHLAGKKRRRTKAVEELEMENKRARLDTGALALPNNMPSSSMETIDEDVSHGVDESKGQSTPLVLEAVPVSELPPVTIPEAVPVLHDDAKPPALVTMGENAKEKYIEEPVSASVVESTTKGSTPTCDP